MMRHLPNLLTVLRMLLVLPLAWLIRERQYDSALIVAAIAGFSDALDGFLAKRYGWQSWLGGLLDPIADKLLLIVSFIALGLTGAHPLWLTWLVIGRDLVIVAGALLYHTLIGRLSAEPTTLSKITTVLQIGYVLLQLVHLSSWIDVPTVLLTAAIWLVAIATLASGLDYVLKWSRRAARVRRATSREK